MPVPLRLATASISSMNTIQGACLFASSNKSRTLDAPTPTNISTKSEPDMLKKGTPASPAIALASSVLPVPGGPTIMTPFGILAPSFVYFPGWARKSTISSSCSFSSTSPATSANVLTLSSGIVRLALLLPKFIIFPPPPPFALEDIILNSTNISTNPIT